MRPSVPARLVCREENTEQLLASLATHALDVVLADTPAPPHVRVRVFNHVLGESDTAFFAPPALAGRMKRRFPQSLHDAVMVAATTNTAVRRDLDHWFEQIDVRPTMLAEFEDPALMKAFGAEAGAVFAAPFAIARDVCRVYGVTVVGRTDSVKERYYAISAERRLTHPGVLAITTAAKAGLFG
jgi:LysR family transcriptional activator of nhaA